MIPDRETPLAQCVHYTGVADSARSGDSDGLATLRHSEDGIAGLLPIFNVHSIESMLFQIFKSGFYFFIHLFTQCRGDMYVAPRATARRR